jgi:hypothetical protein
VAGSEPITLEEILRDALRSVLVARESIPFTDQLAVREAVTREVVHAQLSIGRALQLIGAGP